MNNKKPHDRTDHCHGAFVVEKIFNGNKLKS